MLILGLIMRRIRQNTIIALCVAAALSLMTGGSWASTDPATAGGAAHGLNPIVLVGLAVILVIAKFGGELFERFNQPAVVGEFVAGIILGNLTLVGLTSIEQLKTDSVIGALAEIGVIILLFEVGLESNLTEMVEVGWSALLVAVIGVLAPFFLGWAVAAYFIPEEATLGHIFIGATLCATSVGITARVLKDIKKLQTREARIILGAAVIDDVLGLLILAVITGTISAADAGRSLAVLDIALIAFESIAFLVIAIAVGKYLMPHLFRGASWLETRGVLLAFTLAFCLLLAWLAALVGLAPIVGAFAAGLVLDEVHFESFTERGEKNLEQLLGPVSTLLVPIFFVLMGLKVDLRVFARVEVLGFAAALTAVAIIGKQFCSVPIIERRINRLAVGLGMIPRGEVGLIFASIGAALSLPNAEGARVPVINSATFGALVIMVIITTLVTPPLLKWAMARTAN